MGRSRFTAVADQYVRMQTDQTDGRLVIISGLIAADFRVPAGDLRSRNREQRIAFVRQLAMFLSRKITGAPFKLIGVHFHRDHSPVIHAYQLIEQRIQRDTAFRLFIKQLEARIVAVVFMTIPIGRGTRWLYLKRGQITVIADAVASRFGAEAISAGAALGHGGAVALGLFHPADARERPAQYRCLRAR